MYVYCFKIMLKRNLHQLLLNRCVKFRKYTLSSPQNVLDYVVAFLVHGAVVAFEGTIFHVFSHSEHLFEVY